MEFPNEKLGGQSGYQWKTPTPSVAVRFKVGLKDNNEAWKKYLVRELSKVPGGMDGLVFNGDHFTNQEVA